MKTTMIKGSDKLKTIKLKEFFVIEVLRQQKYEIKTISLFSDNDGNIIQFSTYKEAEEKIKSLLVSPYLFSINKYFKLCSD